MDGDNFESAPPLDADQFHGDKKMRFQTDPYTRRRGLSLIHSQRVSGKNNKTFGQSVLLSDSLVSIRKRFSN